MPKNEKDEARARLKEWRDMEMDMARSRVRSRERDEALHELMRKALPGLLGDAYVFAGSLTVSGDWSRITVSAEFIFPGCALLGSSDEKLSELSAAILTSRLQKWRREVAGQPVTASDAGDADGKAYLKWLPGAPDETTKGANDGS